MDLHVQSRGVSVFSIASTDCRRMHVDGAALPLRRTDDERLYFELMGAGWEVGAQPDADDEEVAKTERMSGPAFDLFWQGAVFVPGTMGDEAENLALRSFADAMSERWRSGADSTNPYPSNRKAAMEYPVLADSEFVGARSADRNLVVVGSPRTNLLLTRWRTRLPIRWMGDGPPDAFIVRGQTYDDPLDAAFVVCPRPDAPNHYLLIVSPASIAALGAADRVRVAHLPDFLIHRAEKVLAWGYFGMDWA
jgi:hypothetical protein